MSTRQQPSSRTPEDAYATSRDSAALPIVMELAMLLESVAMLLPDGAARMAEVATHIFRKPALFSEGTEARSAGEILGELFHPQYPVLLRSWAANVPECSTFVVDEGGVTAWLSRWVRGDGVGDDQLGRGLATRVNELQAALTRRIRRWAGSERVPTDERICADTLPDELRSFLSRHARNISVAVAAGERGYVTLRLQW